MAVKSFKLIHHRDKEYQVTEVQSEQDPDLISYQGLYQRFFLKTLIIVIVAETTRWCLKELDNPKALRFGESRYEVSL